MDKIDMAIKRLQTASQMSLQAYKQPLLLTYSGGKDSEVILDIAQKAKIPFEVCNSHTTVDAPQTVYHIRKRFKELEQKGIKAEILMPKHQGKPVTMWTLIPIKMMPPTRLARYCCQVLKEGAGDGRMVCTGVRWAESTKRKRRRAYEIVGKIEKNAIRFMDDNDDMKQLYNACQMRSKTICNPIIDWSDEEVWDYLHEERIDTNILYNMGFKRIGCIGCPMANCRGREFEFSIFPTYKMAYIRAFGKMLEERKRKGKDDITGKWKDAESVFHWWMEDGFDENQITLDQYMNEISED